MSQRRFTRDHEWIELKGDEAIIGITAYAQQQLGDVVFVELPKAGKSLKAGDGAAVVESVKAASDVYAPLDGTVTRANDTLAANPALVNEDAEGNGWFFAMKLADAGAVDGLLDREGYDSYLAGL